MKKSKKTKGWEAVPVRLLIPLMPEPVLTGQSKLNPKEIQFRTARSFVTSVGKAERFTQGKLTECRKFIKQSNFDKFHRIIQGVPSLQESRYIQENLHRYRNRMHGSRGRPAGMYSYNPTLIAGFVNGAIASGQAHNKEQAFLLATDFFNLDYEAAKRYFYGAINADKFQATLVETGEALKI